MKTIVFFALLLMAGVGLPSRSLQKESGSLQVIPDTRMPADPAGNILYAPTFRAAWTMLKDDIIKSDIRLKKPVPVVKYLNQNPYSVRNDPDWMALAGFVDTGIIDRINAELLTRFNTRQSGLEKYAGEKDGIICYSRFHKSITFNVPFETMNWTFNSGNTSTEVKCFGVTRMGGGEKERMRKQTQLFDYRNPDDFILILSGADPGKEIVLAKTEFQGSVQEMIGLVNDRIRNSYPDGIADFDELIIPKINLSENHTYRELIGKFLANRDFQDYFFAEAGQEISFSLNETGAVAEATGTIVKIKGPVPRNYVFDKPFLLIFRNVGSDESDLVLWVANTDFLVPSV
ncbi:MAG: hypothetical protein V2A67_03920 [Bacteroidota bacterium]